MPYTRPLGNVYDSGEFQTLMDEAMRRADWDGFPARRTAADRRGRLRGIGLGYYIEKGGGGSPETADVRFPDAGRDEIRIGTQSTRQGPETPYAQILLDHSGIRSDRLRVLMGQTRPV